MLPRRPGAPARGDVPQLVAKRPIIDQAGLPASAVGCHDRAHAWSSASEGAPDIPHLSLAAFAASLTPADTRSTSEHQAAALANALIEEVEAADVIVLAAPMYNFSIPSTLKAWIDHITRAGRTFRYGAAGAEGLLKGKKVFIIIGRGGIYSGDSPAKDMDFQEPYLRAMLGFLGLDDVTFIHVEGLKISPEAAASGIGHARKTIGDLLPIAAAA